MTAILGSPHRGDTLDLTRGVDGELERIGEVEFVYLHLKDLVAGWMAGMMGRHFKESLGGKEGGG